MYVFMYVCMYVVHACVRMAHTSRIPCVDSSESCGLSCGRRGALIVCAKADREGDRGTRVRPCSESWPGLMGDSSASAAWGWKPREAEEWISTDFETERLPEAAAGRRRPLRSTRREAERIRADLDGDTKSEFLSDGDADARDLPRKNLDSIFDGPPPPPPPSSSSCARA